MTYTYIQFQKDKIFLLPSSYAIIATHNISYRYQTTAFCGVTPCTLVIMNHHIERLCCLYLQGSTLTKLHGVTSHLNSFFVSQLHKNFHSSLGFLNTLMNARLICITLSTCSQLQFICAATKCKMIHTAVRNIQTESQYYIPVWTHAAGSSKIHSLERWLHIYPRL